MARTTAVKSPLRWPGGKGRLARRIVDLLPPHKAYLETCCGGAAVFWLKPRDASTAEILNDVDGALINFYWILHKSGRRLAREVDGMPYSRELFARQLAAKPRSPFGRARRFWYLNRVAFGGKLATPAFGVSVIRRSNVLAARILTTLEETIERLRGVLFESIDVTRVLKLYDRPTTLFYVDPPFWGFTQDYVCVFDDADHNRLHEALAATRGTWLLSYNDCPHVRALYRGYRIRRLATRYMMGCNAGSGSGARKAQEVLITNRPLRPVTRKMT